MNKLNRLTYFAAVLITLALCTESRAIAQMPRAVLMRNQDAPGRNPYFGKPRPDLHIQPMPNTERPRIPSGRVRLP